MANDIVYAGVISELTLPGGSIYQLKDAQAREDIEKLSNATHFIGVSTTPVIDEHGKSVEPTIGGETVTPENGDIVIYNSTEYVFTGVYGEGGYWSKFGDASLDDLGDLAFADIATGSSTPTGEITGASSVTASEVSLSASEIPVTFGSAEVTGATAITTISSTASISYVTGFDGEFTFSGSSSSISVGGTAIQDDVAIDVVKNSATTLELQSPVTGGTSLVYGVSTNSVSVPATFESATIYGTSESTTVVTGQQTINASTTEVVTSATTFSTNANYVGITMDASVSERLVFTLSDGTVTPTWSTTQVLNSSTTLNDASTVDFLSQTFLTAVSTTTNVISGVTPSISGYNVSVPKNTWVESGTVDIAATVTASGDYTPEGSINVPSLATSSATVLNGTSTFYGAVSAYAGGPHTHDIDASDLGVSIGSVTITVTPDSV